MKRFNEYLAEDFDPAIYNHDGGISIDDPTVVDAINSNLEVTTANVFRTPYNALEDVRKVLEYYKIFLPKAIFLDQNHGNDVFEISYNAGLDGSSIPVFKLLILRAATREMQNMHDDVVGIKDLEPRNVAPMETGFTDRELASVKSYKRVRVS